MRSLSRNVFSPIRHIPSMTGVCPDCGTPLPKDAALMGLCPQCLLSMALEDEENPTLQGPGHGGILGERYKAMRVLVRLAEHAGEDVARDEILQAVWDGSPVKAEVLTNAIWELRKSFGDDSRERRS